MMSVQGTEYFMQDDVLSAFSAGVSMSVLHIVLSPSTFVFSNLSL